MFPKHFLTSLASVTLCLSIVACATEQPFVNNSTASASSATVLSSQSLLSETNTPNLNNTEEFEPWREALIRDAIRSGVRESTINAVRPYLTLNEKVLTLDRQQPEFSQTFWTYTDKRLSELRIQAGKLQLFRHQAILNKLETEFGLPAEILVAFWGLETNYGAFLGNFNTLEALTTLAFDPRRSQFFRKELIAALMIIDQGHVTAPQMKGSWAGAIGQLQFMPSVFLKHATDADGDQKSDLWQSTPDALTSAASYLKKVGWQAGKPWFQEVLLPKHFNYALADGKKTFSLNEIKSMQITPAAKNQAWLGASNDLVTLVMPAGYEGPTFITWPNFNVIKRWNNSNNYALSVGLLANHLSNQPSLQAQHPVGAKPWAKQFMSQLQSTLTEKGYDTGGIDGWFGSKSTQALRQFQQDHNLPADGYPNQPTLQKLELTPY